VLDNTNQKAPRSAIRTGKLVLNLHTRIVSVGERPVHLTGKEYGLLDLLSLHKGVVVTTEMALKHLYGGIREPELRINRRLCLQATQKTRPGSRRKSLHRDGMGSGLCPSRPSHHA
jgi:DNA-binding response OmpR family regulator